MFKYQNSLTNNNFFLRILFVLVALTVVLVVLLGVDTYSVSYWMRCSTTTVRLAHDLGSNFSLQSSHNRQDFQRVSKDSSLLLFSPYLITDVETG